MVIGTVRVESGDPEVTAVGVGTGSQTVASWASVLTLDAGSCKDGGDGQKGGDHELGVEEHRENEGLKVGQAEDEGQRESCREKANGGKTLLP